MLGGSSGPTANPEGQQLTLSLPTTPTGPVINGVDHLDLIFLENQCHSQDWWLLIQGADLSLGNKQEREVGTQIPLSPALPPLSHRQ